MAGLDAFLSAARAAKLTVNNVKTREFYSRTLAYGIRSCLINLSGALAVNTARTRYNSEVQQNFIKQ
jgi:hypothetical protein